MFVAISVSGVVHGLSDFSLPRSGNKRCNLERSSDLLGLDWTGFGLKSSPLRFCRDLAPGAPYNPYTIYSKSWYHLVLQ